MSRVHGRWLRQQRQDRGWNVTEMRRRLREAARQAGDNLPDNECLTVMIHRWESDRSGMSERYRLHYAKAFQIPVAEFGAPAIAASEPAGPPAGPASLRDRMQAALGQFCDPATRDQFCFLLGYVSAVMTTTAPAPAPSAPAAAAGPGEGDTT